MKSLAVVGCSVVGAVVGCLGAAMISESRSRSAYDFSPLVWAGIGGMLGAISGAWVGAALVVS